MAMDTAFNAHVNMNTTIMEIMENSIIYYEKPFIYGSFTVTLAIVSVYLYIVLSLGPRLMKQRSPYKCKEYVIIYNIVQVIACVYAIREILDATDFKVYKFWKCQAAPWTPERVDRYFKVAYFFFWLKISELTETVVFVMRKKYNQVSALHVFHHCSMVTLVYLIINHNINGLAAYYPLVLNSIVHVMMYTYYLIAAVADTKVLRHLLPIKKSITVIQMVQFTLILIQSAFIKKNCRMSSFVLTYYAVVIMVMFYGFYDFYTKSYKSAEKAIKKKIQKKHVDNDVALSPLLESKAAAL